MREEEGKSEECEDITREEVYRDLWRVSIGSEYRKVVGRLSGRYGDRDKCSLKGPRKEQSGDTSSTNRRTALWYKMKYMVIGLTLCDKVSTVFLSSYVNPFANFSMINNIA